MVQPIDIAEAVHVLCESTFVPRKLSPPHQITQHTGTTTIYARDINASGVLDHVTGEQVIQAIIEAAGWDMNSPWPGHPSTESVIEILKLKYPV